MRENIIVEKFMDYVKRMYGNNELEKIASDDGKFNERFNEFEKEFEKPMRSIKELNKQILSILHEDLLNDLNKQALTILNNSK